MSDRAIVLGASVAGSAAAQVLADAGVEVVLVERDDLGGGAAARRGVPQGRHPHVLLATGLRALEALFPGLTADLLAQGVPRGDVLADTRAVLNGHELARGDSGLVVLNPSRPLLEAHLHRRVKVNQKVRLWERCDVVAPVASPDRRRVTGVRVAHRDGGREEVVSAGLVVDATGRGSRAPLWLEALGRQRPPEERIEVDLAYATGTFRLRQGAMGSDFASVCGFTPATLRGGVAARIEGDRCLVTLAGMLGDHPPTDVPGFVAFAGSLATPHVSEILREAVLLDALVAFRFPASVRRRYERVPGLPAGFLVVGDAASSFNPLYGQGMTVAALEALALRRHLRAGGEVSPSRFQRDVARVVDRAWTLLAGADLAYPAVSGRRTLQKRIAGAYVPRLQAAAAHDATLSRAFLRVTGLVDRPEALLRPHVAARVAAHHLRARLSQAGSILGGREHRHDNAAAEAVGDP